METYEVVRHGSHMRLKSDLLMQQSRFDRQVRLILLVHVHHRVLLHSPNFVSLPLESQVGKVLLAVDPIPDGSLDLKYYGYQNVLNHLAVLHALWIPQDLLHSRIDFRSARLDELEHAPKPPLDLTDHDLKLELVNLLIDHHLFVLSDYRSPKGPLDLDSRL